MLERLSGSAVSQAHGARVCCPLRSWSQVMISRPHGCAGGFAVAGSSRHVGWLGSAHAIAKTAPHDCPTSLNCSRPS